ncbi:MAG: hypothetical protein WC828_05780 [Thermoleophilia bacterium]|jgi:hypothetical protein
MINKTKIFVHLLPLFLLGTAALFASSCGNDAETQTTTSAHDITQEMIDNINVQSKEDLQIVAGVETDTSVLSQAMTGKALSDMKAGVEKDLGQGKVKKRDYRNLNTRYEQYDPPFAEVFAEFDDYSYYVDSKTGAALSEPTGEHRTYAMALIMEDDRWKLEGIYASSNASTPRDISE